MRFSSARSSARVDEGLGVVVPEAEVEVDVPAEVTGDLPDVPVRVTITATRASMTSEAPATTTQILTLPRRAARRGEVSRGSLGRGRPRGGDTEAFGSASSGTWMASCRAADSSVQKSCAVGGSGPGESDSSAVADVAALAGAPIGTSSSRGPSQSRGSLTTLLPDLASCPPSAVRGSPGFTGFADPFLTAYDKSVARRR
jgi:hypothetical protein